MRELLRVKVKTAACYLYQVLAPIDKMQNYPITTFQDPDSVVGWNPDLCQGWCALVLHYIINTSPNSCQSEKAKEFIEL